MIKSSNTKQQIIYVEFFKTVGKTGLFWDCSFHLQISNIQDFFQILVSQGCVMRQFNGKRAFRHSTI